MEEKWKSIEGCEDIYEVSNLGNVRNATTKCLKATRENSKGYRTVGLCINGKSKTYKVARLVAEAFCYKPNPFCEVNHKDSIRNNDVCTNLEWISHKENVRQSLENRPKHYKQLNESGEPYIRKCKSNNRWQVFSGKNGLYKSFLNLSDAIQYRNQIIKEWDFGGYKAGRE